MKTMNWLIRREFWENKGMFFWAPIVVSALIIVFLGSSMVYGVAHGTIHMADQSRSLTEALAAMTQEDRVQLASVVSASFLAVSSPIMLMFSVTAFFYCLGSMYEERRDRSILFWKSLPVSDSQTVLSKVIAAILVEPLLVIAAAIITAVSLTLILCTALAVSGVNIFGLVFASSAVYTSPLIILALLPVYMLWALPTVGWLMMVSSWARSKVFLWAVGVPLFTVALIKWANHLFSLGWNIDWLFHNVVARLLGGLLPGSWIMFERITPEMLSNGSDKFNMGALLSQSWMTLSGPAVWAGAAAGVAMIAVAIRMRRWKDEG